jgi:hypothetical protein
MQAWGGCEPPAVQPERLRQWVGRHVRPIAATAHALTTQGEGNHMGHIKGEVITAREALRALAWKTWLQNGKPIGW